MAKSILILIVVLLVVMPVRAQDAPAVIGWLSIPRIDLVKPLSREYQVNNQIDLTDLGMGVSLLDGTTWTPDLWDRGVIVGHNPGAFSRLGEMQIGDLILISNMPDYVVYQVSGVYVVDPSDISWLNPTDEQRLVLITCWDNEATRLVIEAVKV